MIIDSELIIELANESKEIFDNIQSSIQKLSQKENDLLIKDIIHDIDTISGAADMFGIDHLTNKLALLKKNIEKCAKNSSITKNEINLLLEKFTEARNTLVISEEEEQRAPIIIRSNFDQERIDTNEEQFPVKLYILDSDRNWEYKNVMLAFNNVDIVCLTKVTGKEQGILIASSEAILANDITASGKMKVIAIGDKIKESQYLFTLPRSVDPAAILAVCQIIKSIK